MMVGFRALFGEKIRLLESFLKKTQEYREAIRSETLSLDEKVDVVVNDALPGVPGKRPDRDVHVVLPVHTRWPV